MYLTKKTPRNCTTKKRRKWRGSRILNTRTCVRIGQWLCPIPEKFMATSRLNSLSKVSAKSSRDFWNLFVNYFSDPVENVEIHGNKWLEHGDICKLTINFAGTGPFDYCFNVSSDPHSVNSTSGTVQMGIDDNVCEHWSQTGEFLKGNSYKSS